MADFPMEMDTFFICFSRKGPIWTGEPSPELEERQKRHVEYLGKLRADGKTFVSGPVEDPTANLRGVTIFKTATIEEAQALIAQDPHVKIGHLVAEIMPWWVGKGYLRGKED
ncbi:MAG: hypothetical protein DPW16_01995 [Chloroflexi bacterium]|nr:hypothetical protein [Chloroflexota bacterium]